MKLSRKTIAITGGASGIGRSLVIECVRRGASVAVADLNQEGMRETKDLADCFLSQDASCTVHTLDVSSLDAWRDFKAAVICEHDAVDGIINNAGITFIGSVEQTSYEQLERVMSINFMGMVYGTKEFLPDLKQRPEALIANVSSVYGLFPGLAQSAYSASKFAIRGFTEVLAQELKGTNVSVSCIHPGHIGTDIILNASREGNFVETRTPGTDRDAIANQFKNTGLSPEKAAVSILDDIEKNERRIMVGKDAVWGDLFSRLSPKRYADVLSKSTS